MKKSNHVFIICMLMAATTVSAQPKPEDQIKYRQSGMMFMRWNMGIIKNQVVKNKQTYNKDSVLAAANVIAAIANTDMESLFSPETANGRGWKDTLVKPEYFYSTEEVKQISDQFKIQANEMIKIAKTGNTDLIKSQFVDLLDACKACHKKFRHKK